MLLLRIRLHLRHKMRCDTAYPQHWWCWLDDIDVIQESAGDRADDSDTGGSDEYDDDDSSDDVD